MAYAFIEMDGLSESDLEGFLENYSVCTTVQTQDLSEVVDKNGYPFIKQSVPLLSLEESSFSQDQIDEINSYNGTILDTAEAARSWLDSYFD